MAGLYRNVSGLALGTSLVRSTGGLSFGTNGLEGGTSGPPYGTPSFSMSFVETGAEPVLILVWN